MPPYGLESRNPDFAYCEVRVAKFENTWVVLSVSHSEKSRSRPELSSATLGSANDKSAQVDLKGRYQEIFRRGTSFEYYATQVYNLNTEWYAKEIGYLKNDPVNGIHLIVNDVDKGPYR